MCANALALPHQMHGSDAAGIAPIWRPTLALNESSCFPEVRLSREFQIVSAQIVWNLLTTADGKEVRAGLIRACEKCPLFFKAVLPRSEANNSFGIASSTVLTRMSRSGNST